MAALTFSHIALTCKDPIAIERFYTRYFGFKRARVVQLGGNQIVFLKNGDCYLELFQASKEASIPPAGGSGPEYPGWRHIAFAVDNVDAKLAELGQAPKITQSLTSFDTFIPGWRAAWIADPEGNIIELNQGYRDQEAPPQL